MLWSLIKIVLFVVAVTALALGADYLLGSDIIRFRAVIMDDYEINLGPLQSVLAIIALVFAVWLLLKLLSLLKEVMQG